MFLNSPQIIPLKVKTNLETCFALQQIHCRYTIFSYKFCLSIKGRHPWNEADKQHFFVWTNWFFCSWPTWKKSPNCPILTEKKKNSLFNFFLNENILIFGIWNLKATKLETPFWNVLCDIESQNWKVLEPNVFYRKLTKNRVVEAGYAKFWPTLWLETAL